eukprot:TRINITY_DN10335_c0_g1_i1.p3 TRINITY_DN10335_c0_g1~~TRINITY_DN10335_c0_g1_i1.p3  ORF type:complete len:118 (-),score=8.23 TRINITY_DN10335_c0_g1_i1:465-818(-)
MEKVVGERFENGELEYCVKWEGLSEDESTWIPAFYLRNCRESIDTFSHSFKQFSNHGTISSNTFSTSLPHASTPSTPAIDIHWQTNTPAYKFVAELPQQTYFSSKSSKYQRMKPRDF